MNSSLQAQTSTNIWDTLWDQSYYDLIYWFRNVCQFSSLMYYNLTAYRWVPAKRPQQLCEVFGSNSLLPGSGCYLEIRRWENLLLPCQSKAFLNVLSIGKQLIKHLLYYYWIHVEHDHLTSKLKSSHPKRSECFYGSLLSKGFYLLLLYTLGYDMARLRKSFGPIECCMKSPRNWSVILYMMCCVFHTREKWNIENLSVHEYRKRCPKRHFVIFFFNTMFEPEDVVFV